jgi:hypothetical protein
MGKGNEEKPSYFSMDSFKKWMETQFHEEPIEKEIIGCSVTSKINVEKLIDKMEVEDGDAYELAEEFHQHGGIINEVDKTNLLIEVKSGTFIIPKRYVKRRPV